VAKRDFSGDSIYEATSVTDGRVYTEEAVGKDAATYIKGGKVQEIGFVGDRDSVLEKKESPSNVPNLRNFYLFEEVYAIRVQDSEDDLLNFYDIS